MEEALDLSFDRLLMMMNESTYFIINGFSTDSEKKNTKMRQAVTPHERLTATLRFLATGKSYEDLK